MDTGISEGYSGHDQQGTRFRSGDTADQAVELMEYFEHYDTLTAEARYRHCSIRHSGCLFRSYESATSTCYRKRRKCNLLEGLPL